MNMRCIDSACFDSRLIRKGLEPVVPFHVTNPKDPGTKLLVDGTISTFVYLHNLYRAIRSDSRCAMHLHEYHLEVARREVKQLEALWIDVINNAKQTLTTVEESYTQRLSEGDDNKNVIHASLCENLMTNESLVWRTKLIMRHPHLTLPLQSPPLKTLKRQSTLSQKEEPSRKKLCAEVKSQMEVTQDE